MLKMKKIHLGLGYLTLALFVLCSVLLYTFVPNDVAMFANLNWIALLLIVIVAITPLGSRKLQAIEQTPPDTEKKNKQQATETLKKQSIKTWLCNIFLLQISVGLIYYGTAMMTGVVLPLAKKTHPEAFMQSLNQILIHNGLFPWALVALFGLCFGIVAYRKNKDGYFNTVILASFKKINPNSGIIIDNIGRSLIYSALALSTIIACISLATIIAGR